MTTATPEAGEDAPCSLPVLSAAAGAEGPRSPLSSPAVAGLKDARSSVFIAGSTEEPLPPVGRAGGSRMAAIAIPPPVSLVPIRARLAAAEAAMPFCSTDRRAGLWARPDLSNSQMICTSYLIRL